MARGANTCNGEGDGEASGLSEAHRHREGRGNIEAPRHGKAPGREQVACCTRRRCHRGALERSAFAAALEQQAATSEILRVIARLRAAKRNPCFDADCARCVAQLCDGALQRRICR
mgnify:CR=1 FL=1